MKEKRAWIFVAVFFISLSFASALVVVSQVNVNPQNIVVIYNEFISTPGTTNFNSMNNAALANINPMILATSSGKIEWLNTIDLTLIHTNFVVNLDSHIDIGQQSNTIVIGNDYFTNLAGNVRITFNNINFATPEVLKNGQVCTDCQLVSYLGGAYVFTNTLSSQVNTFVIQEKPVQPPPSGGGGGGGGNSKKANFTITPPIVNIAIRQGESVTQTFELHNNGNTPLNIAFDYPALVGLASADLQYLPLKLNEKKNVVFTFSAVDRDIGVYVGKITASNGVSISRDVDVVVQVIDKDADIGLSLYLTRDVLRKYSRLDSSLDIIPVTASQESTLLQYKITDFDGNEFPLQEEDILVEESTTLKRGFSLPSKLTPGNYVLYAVMIYGDKQAISAQTFELLPSNFWLYMLILTCILGVVGAITIYHDVNLLRFRSVIHAGIEALKTGDMKKARDRYDYLSKHFYLLSQTERVKAKSEGLRYYSEIRKKIKGK